MLTKGAYFYESGSGVNLKSRKITFKIGDLFRICFYCLEHECGRKTRTAWAGNRQAMLEAGEKEVPSCWLGNLKQIQKQFIISS